MPFTWRTRILFVDTDASGRIHFTCLFRFFEAAEIEFFRQTGVLHNHPGVAFPRVHVEADYRAALRFDEIIDVELTIGRMGSTSIELCFSVKKEDGGEAARGKVVIACMDRTTQKAATIPANVREALLPHVSR